MKSEMDLYLAQREGCLHPDTTSVWRVLINVDIINNISERSILVVVITTRRTTAQNIPHPSHVSTAGGASASRAVGCEFETHLS